MQPEIDVVVVGACGKMGREVVRAVQKEEDLRLVGAVDRNEVGREIGEVVGLGSLGISICASLEEWLATANLGRAQRPCVMVDFTRTEGLLERIQTALSSGVYPVVGTTGLTQSDLTAVGEWCRQYRRGAIIAPNFAVGAVVMMKLATLAARHFASVEIVELHHDRKLDAPSGTAIKTAQLMSAVRKPAPAAGEEKVRGARGGEVEGIHVHSVRLPGLVAHQEVIFGNPGEVLTIRHDSLSRESFMPGVLMAIRRVVTLEGLLYGIEPLLFPEG